MISKFRSNTGSQGDGQDRSISKLYDPAFNPNFKFRCKTKNNARRLDKISKFQTMSKDDMRIKKIGENEKVVVGGSMYSNYFREKLSRINQFRFLTHKKMTQHNFWIRFQSILFLEELM